MFIFVLVLFGIIFVYLIWNTQKKRGQALQNKYTPRINELMKTYDNDPIKSILQVDSLLCDILKYMGYQGTMGEILKKSSKLFSKNIYQRVWDVHKLRNKIAHESHTKEIEAIARNYKKDVVSIFRYLGFRL